MTAQASGPSSWDRRAQGSRRPSASGWSLRPRGCKLGCSGFSSASKSSHLAGHSRVYRQGEHCDLLHGEVDVADKQGHLGAVDREVRARNLKVYAIYWSSRVAIREKRCFAPLWNERPTLQVDGHVEGTPVLLKVLVAVEKLAKRVVDWLSAAVNSNKNLPWRGIVMCLARCCYCWRSHQRISRVLQAKSLSKMILRLQYLNDPVRDIDKKPVGHLVTQAQPKRSFEVSSIRKS